MNGTVLHVAKKYWNNVEPIFSMLIQEKSNGTNWSDLDDKENDVYFPLLRTFLDEVDRTYKINSDIADRMFEYLVGIKDYYKTVSNDSKRLTLIHTFNLHGTLNQPSRLKMSAFEGHTADLANRNTIYEG